MWHKPWTYICPWRKRHPRRLRRSFSQNPCVVNTFHLITLRCDSDKITRTPSLPFRHLSLRRKNVVNQYLPSKHAGSDPHPIQIGSHIRSGQVLHDMIRDVCGRTQLSLKWETGSGPVVLYQKPGQMIPAHRLVSRPDAFGQTLIRPSRSDLGQF